MQQVSGSQAHCWTDRAACTFGTCTLEQNNFLSFGCVFFFFFGGGEGSLNLCRIACPFWFGSLGGVLHSAIRRQCKVAPFLAPDIPDLFRLYIHHPHPNLCVCLNTADHCWHTLTHLIQEPNAFLHYPPTRLQVDEPPVETGPCSLWEPTNIPATESFIVVPSAFVSY